jgi:hypothetical protein
MGISILLTIRYNAATMDLNRSEGGINMKSFKTFQSFGYIVLFFSVLVMVAAFGCTDGDDVTILLDRSVIVPGGGGGVDVTFMAANGDRIRITLTATDTSIEPYGHLQFPDGSTAYYPPIDTVVNGQNSIELDLNQTGAYILTIFDGSNQGGQVQVKIELLP